MRYFGRFMVWSSLLLGTFFFLQNPFSHTKKRSLELAAASLKEPKAASFIPLSNPPGKVFFLNDVAQEQTISIRVVTSQVFPHYTSYEEAKSLCESLGIHWRLPSEGELYGIRSLLAYAPYVEDALNGEKTFFSTGKYWTSTYQNGFYKVASMLEDSTYHQAAADSLNGVLCFLPHF